jgi:peptidoglycan lytic transglycosylase
MKQKSLVFIAGMVLIGSASSPRAQQTRAISVPPPAEIAAGITVLTATNHPAVPRELSQLWLAPAPSSRSASNAPLSTAAKLAARGEYSKALSAVLQPITQQGLLADYATYYAGMAQLQLARPTDALKTFKALRDRKLVGYLTEAAALGEAAARETLNDADGAVSVYEHLVKNKPMNLDGIYMRLGHAARLAHERNKAADAFAHVYYEFALSDHAAEAGAELALLDLQPGPAGSERYKLELGRAERLFAVKQYGQARAAFEALRPRAANNDRELIQLRLAECDYYQKRARDAHDHLTPLVDAGSRRGEALYFYAVSARDLGDVTTYVRTTRRVVNEFPSEPWAEEALNTLASFYVRRDDDDAADEVFRELYAKQPKGMYAERAAWKIGWRSYRQKRYGETVAFFERAASDFPRSDYRPSWLYWAGRAHEQVKDQAGAEQRYLLVATDYLNSYYGRLAVKRLGRTPAQAAVVSSDGVGASNVSLPPSLPPTAPLIRALLAADLFDDAMNELKYAQKNWGDSPAIQATIAWTNQQLSTDKTGVERFQLLRGSITTMRRAYPQFIAAGGEDLPRDVLTVIFPVAYWDLIRRNAVANNLDPYLVAALVAQESTFVADIKSSANAWGLMQLLPGTARQYARKLKLQYSSKLLTNPEVNVRMGTRMLADTIKDYGDVHLALASYNAGDRAVRRWMQERPGLEREEFIDDIPYPETQNYVKRILGTAEDYRRLYGPSNHGKS